jgi:pSer/pThr/pTyr-binding forkhead associated (FHA) protein
VIVCPRCSKENQDHYKFCLGCGSELPREATTPRVLSPRTPSSSALSAAQAAAQSTVSSAAEHVQSSGGQSPLQSPSIKPAVENKPQNGSPASSEKALQFALTQQGSASDPPARPQVAPPISIPAPPPPPPIAAAVSDPTPTPPAPSPRSPDFASSVGAPNNCPSCGNPVPIDFKFCGTCGQRMPNAGMQPSAASPAAPTTAGRPSRGSLVVINPDGTEGGLFSLADGSTSIGRNAGSVFSADAYLSPTHATFTFAANGCTVKDENSLNGVYVKLKRDVPIKLNDGDIFRIGQELVRFEVMSGPQFVQGVEPMGSPNPGYPGRLSLVIGRESTGNAYPIPPDGMHLGRERGDVIFPEDGYVSGLHCRVHYDGNGCVLTDVGSSNGTFLRVRGSRTITTGDLLLMGQQLFRVQA